MKQNKKAKICFVIYIAGFIFLKDFCYEVIVKQKIYKRASNCYSSLMFFTPPDRRAALEARHFADFPALSLTPPPFTNLATRSAATDNFAADIASAHRQANLIGFVSPRQSPRVTECPHAPMRKLHRYTFSWALPITGVRILPTQTPSK